MQLSSSNGLVQHNMTRLLTIFFLLLVSGCAVVTSYPYKPVSSDSVVKLERCSVFYKYVAQIDEGVTLDIRTSRADEPRMTAYIQVVDKELKSLHFLDKRFKIESGDDGSIGYGEVKLRPATGVLVADVEFGKFFPKKFTLYLPEIQTSKKVIAVAPITFEMQTEKSAHGILCGL